MGVVLIVVVINYAAIENKYTLLSAYFIFFLDLGSQHLIYIRLEFILLSLPHFVT